MVMTVNVSKYVKLINIAKDYGYGETVFRVPLADLKEVEVWLTENGYGFIHLDPITTINYMNRALGTEHQRLLVEWRG